VDLVWNILKGVHNRLKKEVGASIEVGALSRSKPAHNQGLCPNKVWVSSMLDLAHHQHEHDFINTMDTILNSPIVDDIFSFEDIDFRVKKLIICKVKDFEGYQVESS